MIAEGPPILERNGSIATIRLRRPSQRNSLQDVDLRTMLAYFDEVNADRSIRVLVVSADTLGQARPVFSAGYDVAGFDSGAHDPQLFEKVPDAIETLRPITVCALTGSVYGGATDLLLACDVRVAVAGSVFRMPAVALGLHYYPSGLRRYVTRLGLNTAKRAFLTAQPIPVEQLQQQTGLFHQIVGPPAFNGVVHELTVAMAALAPLAAELTKQSLKEIAEGSFDASALRSRETTTLSSSDFAEGRAAFAAKRVPHFKGH